jgi:hypothetical protein
MSGDEAGGGKSGDAHEEGGAEGWDWGSYGSPNAATVDVSAPKTKTKPARPGQRYATSFLLSSAHSTFTIPPLSDPQSSSAERGMALALSN